MFGGVSEETIVPFTHCWMFVCGRHKRFSVPWRGFRRSGKFYIGLFGVLRPTKRGYGSRGGRSVVALGGMGEVT